MLTVRTKGSIFGSLDIATTRNCTHFLKIGFVGFILIISTKGINQIKKANCKKEKKFYAYKKIYDIFKNMDAILFGCNSTSTSIFDEYF